MLSLRAAGLTEIMDTVDCDPGKLARTYRDFALVNTAVAGWSLLYRRFLWPVLSGHRGGPVRLLDIGCGGGDVLHRLVRRARRDGISVEAVGIDPDTRAIDFARERHRLHGLTFRATTASALADAGERFTIVLSNHLLHHLTEEEVTSLCRASEQLTTALALHNDIHRHPLAYAGFPLIGGLFPNSFILSDGMRSIRRSFTPAELRNIAAPNWEVRSAPPFRCLLVHRR